MICQKMLIVLCGLTYVTERGADEMEFKSLEVHSSRKGLNVFPSRKWIKCSQVVRTSSTFSATEESLIEDTAITNLHPVRYHAQIVYGPSGTYGSRNRCGSFQERTWLSGSQTNHSRFSSSYCKTANTSTKAFQSYHRCRLQFSYILTGQVSVALKDYTAQLENSNDIS